MKYLHSMIIIGVMAIFLAGCTHQQPQQIEPEGSQAAAIIPSYDRTIYVLGDSISAGYQLPIEQSYPKVLERMLLDAGYRIRVINAGESGDTSDGLIDRLDWIISDSMSGDLAIVVIGGNDGLRGLSTIALQDNLTQIITRIQARGMRTIVGGMQIPTNLGPEYTTAFAQVYPDVADATDSDLIPFVLTGVGGISELNLPDGIHPNTTGQIMVAQTVYDFLVENKMLSQ